MHQQQSGLKLKLRSTLVNNDEKKMAIGEMIIHQENYMTRLTNSYSYRVQQWTDVSRPAQENAWRSKSFVLY